MAVVLDLTDDPRPRHPEKARRPDSGQPPKPDWIRVKAPVSPGYMETRDLMRANGLHTVCEEAGCPNIGECWEKKHATFMIMGDTCTRACSFCNVKTGLPGALDSDEPAHVGQATAKLGLSHIVVTSVDRDDLADGGAQHFADTIGAIRASAPGTTIEVLTPDFLRKDGALEDRGCGQARRLQPQSGDRAVPLSHGAAGRALFPFSAAVAAGEGARARRCSPSPASWWASVKNVMKFCR